MFSEIGFVVLLLTTPRIQHLQIYSSSSVASPQLLVVPITNCGEYPRSLNNQSVSRISNEVAKVNTRAVRVIICTKKI